MKKSILFMVFTITLTSVSCSNNIERVSPKAVVSSATVDKSSDSYTLTKYDNTKIRFYLQEYDNKNKTKEDLSEIYKIYGTAKIKHVRQEMNKEFQQNRLEQKMKRKKKLEKEALERKRNLILKSCNKNLNEELLSYIDKVPDDIINVILNMGYHIELVKNPGEEFNMRYICGLTIPNKKRILIQANKYKFRRSVVHEIAHAYDDYLDWISNSKEFGKIYNAEKKDFKVHDYTTSHYLDNNYEYFAEAFQEYIYYPDKLKSNTPKTYNFIKKYMRVK